MKPKLAASGPFINSSCAAAAVAGCRDARRIANGIIYWWAILHVQVFLDLVIKFIPTRSTFRYSFLHDLIGVQQEFITTVLFCISNCIYCNFLYYDIWECISHLFGYSITSCRHSRPLGRKLNPRSFYLTKCRGVMTF